MKLYSPVDYLEILSEKGLVIQYNINSRHKEESISNLTYNTATVKPKALFICKGANFKAEYVKEAKDKGAILFVAQQDFGFEDSSYILVSDIRAAMPAIAALHYNNPQEKLYKIGITGTKGKSTTAYFIKSIIDEHTSIQGKRPCALISSIENYDGTNLDKSMLTTPESPEIYRYMSNSVGNGIEHLVMEASSQGLKYNRLDGINFEAAAFLNIGNDHISPLEHSCFEDYLSSKMRIFDNCSKAFINTSMDCYTDVVKYIDGRVDTVTFGFNENAQYYGYYIRQERGLISFYVKCPKFNRQFSISMKGMFNVENALCAIAICSEMGISPSCIARGLLIARVKGRMEYFCSSDERINVIVDYAHNKLSFEKLFSSVKTEFSDKPIVAVFGCPGNKAYDRRHELPRVASQFCSHIYITEDDPGDEDPCDIAKQVASNIQNGCPYTVIHQRGEAIKDALEKFGRDCVVVIAGKGGETTQKKNKTAIDYPGDKFFVEEFINCYDKSHNSN